MEVSIARTHEHDTAAAAAAAEEVFLPAPTELPSRARALELAETSKAFYRVATKVAGHDVEVYSYRLVGGNGIFRQRGAHEMRGLTFVRDARTGAWTRHIALNKFFNLNEVAETHVDALARLRVVSATEKADGSMVTFVRLPCGAVRAKSKTSFESPQAAAAQRLYAADADLRAFVDAMGERGKVPIFEFVAPTNQIVLEYAEPRLVLLQVRDAATGAWAADAAAFARGFRIKATPQRTGAGTTTTLADLAREAQAAEGLEGWVVVLEDGSAVKVKTRWYVDRHRVSTTAAENKLVEAALGGRIDDMISLMSGAKKTRAREVARIVARKSNELVALCAPLVAAAVGVDMRGDAAARKDYVMKYSRSHEEMFPHCLRVLMDKTTPEVAEENQEEVARKVARRIIARQTRTRKLAKAFVDEEELRLV